MPEQTMKNHSCDACDCFEPPHLSVLAHPQAGVDHVGTFDEFHVDACTGFCAHLIN